jgi:hypothetical protein
MAAGTGRRVKSRGPEIVISLTVLGFLTLAGMCIYVRGCGGENMMPVFAAQGPAYLQLPPWNLYAGPFAITQSTTLNVVAVSPSGGLSPIVTATYTINPPNGPQSPGFLYPSLTQNLPSQPRAQIAKVSGGLPLFAFRTSTQPNTFPRHGEVILPNLDLTPGVVGLTTKEQICAKDVRPGAMQPVSETMTFQVCAEYTIDRAHCVGLQPDGSGYKIDHLIPLELGGTDDKENLWPQPYNPRPAVPEKIAIGSWLRSQVCSDQMGLAVAQRAISGDWYQTFQTAIAGEKQWPQNAFIEKTRIRRVAASGKVSGGVAASGN